MRAFEHGGYYPKQVSLSQGGIVESEPFSGLRRVFGGRFRGAKTDNQQFGHFIADSKSLVRIFHKLRSGDA